MLETVKKIYTEYKPIFKGLFTVLGVIAIFDWLIAPGLTVANTFINVLSFVAGSVIILFFGLLVWDNGFKNLIIKKEKWQGTSSETDGQNSNKDNENSTNKDNENSNN